MQIIPGFYNLSQVRHLAFTKDHSGNFMFMVTLRDDQVPAILPEVDLTHWLWVDQNSVATVWFKELPVMCGFSFIREFEKMYLVQEPAHIVPQLFEEMTMLNLQRFEYVMHSDELAPATDKLRKEPLWVGTFHDNFSIVEIVQHVVLEFISDVRLKKPLFLRCGRTNSVMTFIVIVDLKCSVFEVGHEIAARHAYDLTAYVNGLTPLFMRATRGGAYRSPNVQEAQANLFPRGVSLDGTKIRNASISGMRLPTAMYHRYSPIHPSDAGIVAELDAESPTRRMVGFGEHVPVGTVLDGSGGLHPSDKDLHGPNGELLARAIPGRGKISLAAITRLRQPLLNHGYFPNLGETPWGAEPMPTAKTDGPIPEPIAVPWSQVVRLFRMQILGLLQEKHGMSCDEAIAYLNTHALCEDDDKLLRPLMLWAAAKPLPSLW